MTPFDRNFLEVLLEDGSSSLKDDIDSMSDSDIEKIAVTLPAIPTVASLGSRAKGLIGSGMQGLTATVPLKTIGGGAGAIYGAMQDPGYDPMTGQPNSRAGNIALGALGGLAAGAGIQRGARAALGMRGKTGDYLRSAQLATARGTTHLKDQGLSYEQLANAYRNAGLSAPVMEQGVAASPVGKAIAQTRGSFTMKPSANVNVGEDTVMLPAGYRPASTPMSQEVANVRPAIRPTQEQLRVMNPGYAPIAVPSGQGPVGPVATMLPGSLTKIQSVDFSKLASYVSWSKTAAGGNFLVRPLT